MPRQPGAKAIVVYQEKMLLILRDDNPEISFPNTWSTPGGGIEENETPEEAVRRELAEEISVIPSDIQIMKATEYVDQSIVHRFFMRLTEEEYKKVSLGNEGQRLDWFTFDEAMALELSPDSREYFVKNEYEIRRLMISEDV